MSDEAKRIAEESGRERFVFVDALRGIAALMVLSHHLLHNTVLEVPLRQILPAAVCAIFSFNARGVEIFFVISGFVVAHSMRSIPRTVAGACNFIVRRQLRLDPPYWALIALTLLDTVVENRFPSLVHKSLPSALQVVFNLFYLQNIVKVPQVVGVAWTLCLEVQFYLVFILAHLVGRVVPPPPGHRGVSSATLSIVFILGITSLLRTCSQAIFPTTFFLPFWPYFAAGVLCYWKYRGDIIAKWAFPAFVVGFLLATFWLWSSHMLVGLITVLALFVAGERQKLCTWMSNGVLQYFGRISYSLYLVHLLVLSAIMRGGYKLTHSNRWAALGWFVTAAVGAVGAAHGFHKVVEAPSMRLAARFKPKPRDAAIAPPTAVSIVACATPDGMAGATS